MLNSAADWLHVWEYGRHLGPPDRAAWLLRASHPQLTPDQVDRLSLGQLEALLLQVRQSWFGAQLASVAVCPACGEQLEFSFSAADLGALDYPAPPPALEVAQGAYQLTLRPPTLADWRLAAGEDVAGAALFQRCVIAATVDGAPLDVATAPATLAQLAAQALQQADPLVEMALALTCPACGHAWSAPLNALAFLWQELEAWAWRTLHTVHRLASAYGWSEAEILRLSAWRRQYYLTLLDGTA